MQPLPVELWLKILDFTLHPCEPADIPLYFPFIISARARQNERELVAQDKAMLRVLGLVCRSWREMCLSFGSRRVHIRLGDSVSGKQSKMYPSDCTMPSVSTILLQLSSPNSGLDPVQYAQLVESTIAKAPGVRFLQITTAGPNRHFLPLMQHALSALSRLSSLDIPNDRPLDIENVLPAVAGIPQLRTLRCHLVVTTLPTIDPPLLLRLEVLSICIDNLISEGETQALEKWLGRWRMPCLVQLVSIGSWTQGDWSWILGLLEHNGTHLKALHLQVSSARNLSHPYISDSTLRTTINSACFHAVSGKSAPSSILLLEPTSLPTPCLSHLNISLCGHSSIHVTCWSGPMLGYCYSGITQNTPRSISGRWMEDSAER
jgi:hypothetical protein